MAIVTKFNPGTFCWVDVTTTDTEGAKAFYTQLFGLETEDVPAGEGMVYTMLKKGDAYVGGLFAMDPQMQDNGVSPYWASYIAVDDVDSVMEKALSLGAKTIMEPMDVMDTGRMAIIQDPEGAVISLWKSHEEDGQTLKDEPGSLCWNELYVNDLDNAIAFYEALFAWEHSKGTGATGQTYVTFRRGEEMVAGMMQIQPEWGEVPPSWGIYFAVENCDATIEKAELLGGKSAMEPMEIEEVGRFGTIIDPQGAAFMVLQFARRC